MTFAGFRAIGSRLMFLSSSRRCLLLALLLWLALPCTGFAQKTAFEKITIEQGLSQGMIFDILETCDGFLWVATKDGLNRYDGYNFKVFSNDPFDPFSLVDNTVTALFEDSRGWLWVGTEAKGLDLFDPRTGRFHHFSMNLQGNNADVGPGVTKILESPDGTIWALKRGAGLMHIRIPEIGVDAPIEYLEIIDGAMQPPSGATDVTWYKETSRLGEVGNGIYAGHLNYWGIPEGVFFRLESLQEGDIIELDGDDAETYLYQVQWMQNFPSDQEPPDEALGFTDEVAITLITCGGEWIADRAEYDHRTLVRAVLWEP